MELAGMTLEDFSSKLGGSIFRLDGEVFMMDEVDIGGYDEEEDCERDARLYGKILVDRGRTWKQTSMYLDGTKNPTVDISFPQVGYVNYKSGAVYVTRIVERQYKYGYNRRVVNVNDRFIAEREELGMMYREDIVANSMFIARLFDRFFFNYPTAMSLIREGKRLGAALNQHLYIGKSLEFDKPIICYKDKVVGYVDGRTNFLFPEADYVGRMLPNFEIKGDNRDVAIGFDWD